MHDRGALLCMTELGMHTTRLSVHDSGACETKVFCCDRDFSIMTDLYSRKKSKKRKKRTPGIGASQ